MFASNALIGLREGLEASLVVVILVAFLVKCGRRDALRYVWLGVGTAVGLSVLLGAILTFATEGLDDATAETVTGIASLIAVCFVTGMVFWMRSAARSFAGELKGRMDRALDLGPFAVALVAFLGVGREGLETALFFYATVTAADETGIGPVMGWVVGIGSAIALGIAIYYGAVRINLARFFRWTGALLVVVAAGILAYAVHELQEAGVIPGEKVYAFDFTGSLDPKGWFATIVRGIFNLRPRMSVLEFGSWAAYLAVVMTLFLRPARSRGAEAAPAAPAAPAAQAPTVTSAPDQESATR